MTRLVDVERPSSFIIMAVTGRPALVRHLAEMGLLAGKRLTVIQTAQQTAGMLVYFQGQRLAISDEIATQINVQPLTQFEDAVLEPLAALPTGARAIVGRIEGAGQLRQRLLDMGLTRGTLVHLVKVAPLGDPLELAVRGYKLSLRKADAAAVQVERVAADA
ncbi:FeoA family protein [Lacticaseibacillus daqingensis]|uniref:FeoA family protein n=1 Tax=Lacticaseibacillus daqingensis TaxID=2486014 RepID=UPI000F7B6483|nr:ferrous iron transport protein A [Lacticaseibacillus daqingensis]